MLLGALACIAVAAIGGGAVAEDNHGAPSQADIERGLMPKMRGLPTLGTAPAPAPGPSPGYVPATLPSSAPAAPSASHPGTERPSVVLNTITFEFGSAQLRPESIETLRNLGQALNQGLKDEKAFLIEGHTDRTGSAAYNDVLSKQRADAVKDYLVKELGVSPERLQTLGKSFSDPIDPKNPNAAENRRVVVINARAS